jgi:hypothetical protein
MQPASREPEKYSIDEMMERLKKTSSGNEDEEGELVIREDGTQVIRVRKRKRRSKQPQRERERMEQRRRFVRMLVMISIIVVTAALFSGGIIYSNSSPFRNALVEKIQAATGAEVELTQFRMNPASANADTLRLTWPDGHPFESIHARGLRADTTVGSVLGGAFRGDELLAGEGTLTWRVPENAPPWGGAALDPGRVDFQRISISRLHIVPADGVARMFRLRNSEASFYPNHGTGGNAQMRLNGGELQVHGLPKLRLDRALLEFRNDELRLSVVRMFHGADEVGELLISGKLNPLDAGSTAMLAVEANLFNIEGIVGERLGRIIAGRIDSTSFDGASSLRVPVGDPAASVLEIDFKSAINSPMLIRGFNFLAELAMLLEEPWFEQPYFEGDVTGVIRRSGGVVEIRNLQAEHRNRMALRGNIRMEQSGRLSGNIDVGLSPALVAAAPTRRLHPAISEASGGYRWITIEIGGNINAPTDNFMSLVDNPPSRATAPPESGGTGGTSFEDLTRPR